MNMDLLEKEWFIAAPWGRICVVAWGNCLDPPVMLCHGRSDSAASYRPLVRLLPKNFYYICMELPGNGKSDPFPRGLIVGHLEYMYVIEVVRRHFRWEHFVYIGHSFGAAIGRYHRVCYPGRMSKVIELDNMTMAYHFSIDDFSKWYQTYYEGFFEKYELYNSPKENAPTVTWEEAIKKTARIRNIPLEVSKEILERFVEPAGDGLIRLTLDQRIKMPIAPLLSADQLKKFYICTSRTPTLAFVCTKTIELGGFRNAPYYLQEEGYGGSYKVRIIEGTHDVHVSNPERIAPFISQFLLHGLDAVDQKAKL